MSRPQKAPVEYRTGWGRLDSLLTAIAQGVAVLATVVVATIVAVLIWGLV